MTVMSLKKESVITNYFVNKFAKKLFPFFILVSFIFGGMLFIKTLEFNITNFIVIILSSTGFCYLATIIIARIVLFFKTNDAMGNNINHIYHKIKCDLEKLKKEELNLKNECPDNVLFFPAHIDHLSRTDPRKQLARVKTKICLMEMELKLFDY